MDCKQHQSHDQRFSPETINLKKADMVEKVWVEPVKVESTPLSEIPSRRPFFTLSEELVDSGNPKRFQFDTFAGYRFKDPAYLREAVHIPPHNPTQSEPYLHKGSIGPRSLARKGDALLGSLLRAALSCGHVRLSPKEGQTDYHHELSNRGLGNRAEAMGIEEFCLMEAPETYVPPNELSITQQCNALKALITGVYLDSGEDLAPVAEVLRVVGIGCPEGEELLAKWKKVLTDEEGPDPWRYFERPEGWPANKWVPRNGRPSE